MITCLFLIPGNYAGVQASLKQLINLAHGPEGKLKIKISLPKRTLTLYENGVPYKTYPVTIGKPESRSPVGEWVVINKGKKPETGPLGSRWLGLNVPWNVYGIHGTNKPWEIGRATSKGCIRLHNQNVEELYEWVPLGTEVKIIGKRPDVTIDNILKPGATGYKVTDLQEKLRELNYYSSYLDAKYGSKTKSAVMELEAQFELERDGIADWNVLSLLGLGLN